MGPVRLYIPYKRKRKEEKKIRIKKSTVSSEADMENVHNSNNHSKESWQSIAEGIDTSTEYNVMDNSEPKEDSSAGKNFINCTPYNAGLAKYDTTCCKCCNAL